MTIVTFLHDRECILKTAKALVEDTKLLVSGAGASQEKLAQAAQSSVSTITKLADVVKLGAASLGSEDPETQVWTWPGILTKNSAKLFALPHLDQINAALNLYQMIINKTDCLPCMYMSKLLKSGIKSHPKPLLYNLETPRFLHNLPGPTKTTQSLT